MLEQVAKLEAEIGLLHGSIPRVVVTEAGDPRETPDSSGARQFHG